MHFDIVEATGVLWLMFGIYSVYRVIAWNNVQEVFKRYTANEKVLLTIEFLLFLGVFSLGLISLFYVVYIDNKKNGKKI